MFLFLAGLLLGVVAVFIFQWRLLTEAGQRYEEGDRRFEEGTKEYKKALQALEMARDERQRTEEHHQRMCAFYNAMLAAVQSKYPELVKDIERIGEEYHYSGAG